MLESGFEGSPLTVAMDDQPWYRLKYKKVLIKPFMFFPKN